MTEAESLLAIVAAIYVAECAQWVRLDVVVFGVRWARRCRAKHPSFVLGNQEGALVWANPLPPLGPAMIAQMWPVSLSPEAAYSYVPQAVNPTTPPTYSEKFVAWDDLKTVFARDTSVYVNGQEFAKVCSPQLADKLARLLRRLAAAPRQKREELIVNALEKATDTRSVARRLQCFRGHTWFLRALCNLFFVYFFAAGALLVWWPPLRNAWLPILLVLLMMIVWTILEFRATYGRLYRGHRAGWRSHGAMMVFSPMAAIRAYDVASRRALSVYHPLAVAAVLCPRTEFVELARQIVCDLTYPLPRKEEQPPERAEAVAWFQQRLTLALNRVLSEQEVAVDALLVPPSPEGDDCVTYCPRCRTQFVVQAGTCKNCGGQKLLPLATDTSDQAPRSSEQRAVPAR